MFWKPHGKPINLLEVKNGQYVEGWILNSYNGGKRPMKGGYIDLEKIDGDRVTYIHLDQPQQGKRLLGKRMNGKLDTGLAVRCRLYDGDLRKHRKNCIPQPGIVRRLLEGIR